MTDFCKKNGGISIIGLVILAIVVILVLSYFKISIKSVVESPESRNNFSYVFDKAEDVWTKYLKKPANYLWHEIFVKIFWASFINNMERIRDGKPIDLEIFSPQILPGEMNTNNRSAQ